MQDDPATSPQSGSDDSEPSSGADAGAGRGTGDGSGTGDGQATPQGTGGDGRSGLSPAGGTGPSAGPTPFDYDSVDWERVDPHELARRAPKWRDVLHGAAGGLARDLVEKSRPALEREARERVTREHEDQELDDLRQTGDLMTWDTRDREIRARRDTEDTRRREVEDLAARATMATAAEYDQSILYPLAMRLPPHVRDEFAKRDWPAGTEGRIKYMEACIDYLERAAGETERGKATAMQEALDKERLAAANQNGEGPDIGGTGNGGPPPGLTYKAFMLWPLVKRQEFRRTQPAAYQELARQ